MDSKKKEETRLSNHLEDNRQQLETILADCDDIKRKNFYLGKNGDVACLVYFIEVAFEGALFEKSLVGKMLNSLYDMPKERIYEVMQKNMLGICDMKAIDTVEMAVSALLTGDTLVILDGWNKALKIQDKGYPHKNLSNTESEKVIRGSNEGFSDSVKINTALIRRRLRSPKVKVKEVQAGVRSSTNVDFVYMDDLIYKDILESMQERLASIEIDGVLDSGVIEQLTEKIWYSPFPQFMTTERPDRAAQAVLNGQIVLLSDNSPVALIFPTNYNCFVQASDDLYSRFEIVSFTRCIRYIAAFFAMTFPGLYLAVMNFHTQILPTKLLLFFCQARADVPFPGLVEVLIMELSFELLREAGVRLPGIMGNSIGVVGGIIIGQSAVDAGLVSPMVVIVVAVTAICSFTIPNEEFQAAFRLIKFVMIFFCAWFGLFGFLVGVLCILIHLSHLESFGIPYLMPFVGADLTSYEDERDSLFRLPLQFIKRRPIFAKRGERVKLKKTEKSKE